MKEAIAITVVFTVMSWFVLATQAVGTEHAKPWTKFWQLSLRVILLSELFFDGILLVQHGGPLLHPWHIVILPIACATILAFLSNRNVLMNYLIVLILLTILGFAAQLWVH